MPLLNRLTERDIVSRAASRPRRSSPARLAWTLLWCACACIVGWVLTVLAFVLTAPGVPR